MIALQHFLGRIFNMSIGLTFVKKNGVTAVEASPCSEKTLGSGPVIFFRPHSNNGDWIPMDLITMEKTYVKWVNQV